MKIVIDRFSETVKNSEQGYLETNEELKAENKHLKEVLIRCKEYLPEWITPMDILAEIDKLEAK